LRNPVIRLVFRDLSGQRMRYRWFLIPILGVRNCARTLTAAVVHFPARIDSYVELALKPELPAIEWTCPEIPPKSTILVDQLKCHKAEI
jgi:hypothetical protein